MKKLYFSLFMLCSLPLNGLFDNEPYLCKWLFYDAADYTLDDQKDRYTLPFSPEKVRPGSIIFVMRDALKTFFFVAHPKINAPYLLITYGGCAPVPYNFSSFLRDPKLIAWFGTNADSIKHPDIIPIPLGVQESAHDEQHADEQHQRFEELRAMPKTELLYLNFETHEHEERIYIKRLFLNKKFCTFGRSKRHDDNLEEMARHKFVLTPRGTSLDSHLLWEVLYAGSIPIVKSSVLDPLYADLPVLIVSSWQDISEEFLHNAYARIKNTHFTLEKLNGSYWLELIHAYRVAWMRKNDYA